MLYVEFLLGVIACLSSLCLRFDCAVYSCLIIISPQSHVRRMLPV